VMGAALGLCAVIILQLGRGYLKERAEKLAAPTAKSA